MLFLRDARIVRAPFDAQIGPNVSFAESRKNCRLIVEVDAPAGYAYALESVSYRGKLDLAAGLRQAFYGDAGAPDSATTGARVLN